MVGTPESPVRVCFPGGFPCGFKQSLQIVFQIAVVGRAGF